MARAQQAAVFFPFLTTPNIVKALRRAFRCPSNALATARCPVAGNGGRNAFCGERDASLASIPPLYAAKLELNGKPGRIRLVRRPALTVSGCCFRGLFAGNSKVFFTMEREIPAGSATCK